MPGHVYLLDAEIRNCLHEGTEDPGHTSRTLCGLQEGLIPLWSESQWRRSPCVGGKGHLPLHTPSLLPAVHYMASSRAQLAETGPLPHRHLLWLKTTGAAAADGPALAPKKLSRRPIQLSS